MPQLSNSANKPLKNLLAWNDTILLYPWTLWSRIQIKQWLSIFSLLQCLGHELSSLRAWGDWSSYRLRYGAGRPISKWAFSFTQMLPVLGLPSCSQLGNMLIRTITHCLIMWLGLLRTCILASQMEHLDSKCPKMSIQWF